MTDAASSATMNQNHQSGAGVEPSRSVSSHTSSGPCVAAVSRLKYTLATSQSKPRADTTVMTATQPAQNPGATLTMR